MLAVKSTSLSRNSRSTYAPDSMFREKSSVHSEQPWLVSVLGMIHHRAFDTLQITMVSPIQKLPSADGKQPRLIKTWQGKHKQTQILL